MARSRKPSRSSRKCRATGKLKHPVKLPSGKMRYCKKRRSQKYGGNKGDASRSRRDYSRKRSKRGSRSRRCKYGKLKHPVKSPSGRKRVCRKSRSRKHSKKKSRSRRRRSCKFGMLKTPMKTTSGGKRYCKKRRSQK